MAGPKISVVIPVYNSADCLRRCLERLSSSLVRPLEVIAVDDSSTDRSTQVAEELGALTLSTGKRSGPARARNIGARRASGDILFFIDADVLVHADTLARVEAAFASDAELAALIGSYDDSPGAEDFLSQYKNLMHHFTHQTARSSACTFWSGCGAIRREVFLETGGFDESYQRPAVEDIELGYRLFQQQRKMTLDRELQVTHLKKWTFWGLLKCDIFDRGIPWTELILRDRHFPNDLNLHLSRRISVALSFALFGLSLAAAVYWRGYFLTPFFALLFLVLGRYWGEAVSGREAKAAIVWTSLSVAAIVSLAALHHMLGLIPPVLLGFALLLLHHRYAFEQEKRQRYVGWSLAALVAIVLALSVFYLPGNALVFGILVVLLALVALNNQFYVFLAAKKNRLFAVAAIPFHLLYHLYSGISFVTGTLRYLLRSVRPGARAARVGPSRE